MPEVYRIGFYWFVLYICLCLLMCIYRSWGRWHIRWHNALQTKCFSEIMLHRRVTYFWSKLHSSINVMLYMHITTSLIILLLLHQIKLLLRPTNSDFYTWNTCRYRINEQNIPILLCFPCSLYLFLILYVLKEMHVHFNIWNFISAFYKIAC